MESILRVATWIGDKILLPYVLGPVILAIATYFVIRFKRSLRVRCWAWSTWKCHQKLFFHYRQHKSRKNARIVCLEEYIRELTLIRKKLSTFARNVGHDKCSILVKVFTKQLPRDWPIWYNSSKPASGAVPNQERIRYIIRLLGRTPLGRYARDFKDFVSGIRQYAGLRVEVSRYIIIDNLATPHEPGKERLEKLREDVMAPWYANYLELLHGASEDRALYLKYDWSWPGWLSDCVFFGVHAQGDCPRWLWAFATSYSPGEDVLIFRYLYLPKPGPLPEDLPWDVKSLRNMLESPELTACSYPLSSLRRNNSSGNARNA